MEDGSEKGNKTFIILLLRKPSKEKWFEHYKLRICKRERDYGM